MTDQQGSQNQQGLLLTTPFRLASADDLQTPFTTYCQGYVGLLDFVWFEPGRMSVSRTIPLPTQEEVRHTCLPSERFSSDHLAVSRRTCAGVQTIFAERCLSSQRWLFSRTWWLVCGAACWALSHAARCLGWEYLVWTSVGPPLTF